MTKQILDDALNTLLGTYIEVPHNVIPYMYYAAVEKLANSQAQVFDTPAQIGSNAVWDDSHLDQTEKN